MLGTGAHRHFIFDDVKGQLTCPLLSSGELDIDEALRGIDAAFQSLSGAVKTLMLTGVNYMRTKAQLKQFAEQGIEKYWIETTRDERTCTKCLDMHSKQFWVENAKIGENAPPLHPFCRCWIAPWLGQGENGAGKNIRFGSDVKSAEKLSRQMNRRGWANDDVRGTVDNAFTTRGASNRATGNPATAYYNEDGSYIVIDNMTNEVIQVSDRFDPNWIPDLSIMNPYRP